MMSRKQRRAASAVQRKAQRSARAQFAQSTPTAQLTEAQVVVEFMASILKQAQSKAQVAFQVYHEADELLNGNADGKYGLPAEDTKYQQQREGVEEAFEVLKGAQFDARSDVLVAGLDLLDAIDAAELERDDPPRISVVSAVPDLPEDMKDVAREAGMVVPE